MERTSTRIIISGGGTGGHVFPAIAIANAIRGLQPDADLLFVGALGRLEMEKVPAAGYPIEGLPVVGFQRGLRLGNLTFGLKLWRSLRQARRILARFRPHAVVGVGGYASGPVLWMAQRMGVPTLIQEQNSYAGVTNRLLARRARAICVAYPGMERYLPAGKLTLTGNPVRQSITRSSASRAEALAHFGLPPGHTVVLAIGGSLGARTINLSLLGGLRQLLALGGVCVLWQTGRLYYSHIGAQLEGLADVDPSRVRLLDFIDRMDLAYAAADIIVSRAGACTISELCVVGKPTVLIPSPNVAEDHQTRNARALVAQGAAVLVTDGEAPRALVPTIEALARNEAERQAMGRSLRALALPQADVTIARKVLEIAGG